MEVPRCLSEAVNRIIYIYLQKKKPGDSSISSGVDRPGFCSIKLSGLIKNAILRRKVLKYLINCTLNFGFSSRFNMVLAN